MIISEFSVWAILFYFFYTIYINLIIQSSSLKEFIIHNISSKIKY
ncbi:hypothetical protein AsAng_0048420 [Aureispira anguillae]|uniref:Uncharacterized protein n=1 Tax=Aureispira anguillae TaxID=2864201 RepID=A0A916DV75_9BACT|nr:hypothetical protein AsAng_0048420 [Aureispira anguillae]